MVVSQSLQRLPLTHVLCVSVLELLESGATVEHGCLHMCACADVLKEQDAWKGFS